MNKRVDKEKRIKDTNKNYRTKIGFDIEMRASLLCNVLCARWFILILIVDPDFVASCTNIPDRRSRKIQRRYCDNNASASVLRRQFHFKWGPCELDRYKDMVQGKRERSTAPRGLMLKSNGLKNLRWRTRWRRIYFFSNQFCY